MKNQKRFYFNFSIFFTKILFLEDTQLYVDKYPIESEAK